MAGYTTFDESPGFDVGDRVVVTTSMGPRWHRTTRSERGIVVARSDDRLIAVRFDDGHVEHVHPSTLTLAPADPQR